MPTDPASGNVAVPVELNLLDDRPQLRVHLKIGWFVASEDMIHDIDGIPIITQDFQIPVKSCFPQSMQNTQQFRSCRAVVYVLDESSQTVCRQSILGGERGKFNAVAVSNDVPLFTAIHFSLIVKRRIRVNTHSKLIPLYDGHDFEEVA